MRAVVDTNLLIRIITQDDPARATAANALIEAYQAGEVLLGEAVVSEAVYVLQFHAKYKLPRPKIAKGLRHVFTIPQLSLDEELLGASLDLYAATKLDFVDCLVLAQQRLGRVQDVLTQDIPLQKYLK